MLTRLLVRSLRGGCEGRLAHLLTWALVSANRSKQHMGQGAELGTGVDPKLPLGATGAPLKYPSKLELAEKTQLQMSFRRLLKEKRCGSGRSYLRALILAPWTCQQPSGGYSTARVRAKMRGSKVRGDITAGTTLKQHPDPRPRLRYHGYIWPLGCPGGEGRGWG